MGAIVKLGPWILERETLLDPAALGLKHPEALEVLCSVQLCLRGLSFI